jgi:cytochrome c peroxidase
MRTIVICISLCIMPGSIRLPLLALLATVSVFQVGCGGGGGDSSTPVVPGAVAQAQALSDVVALGQKIFNDPGLSASGRQSCAS